MLIAIHPTEHHRDLRSEKGLKSPASLAVSQKHVSFFPKTLLFAVDLAVIIKGALVYTPSSLYMKQDRWCPTELNYLYFGVVLILVFSSESVVPNSTRSCFRGEGGDASSGRVGAGWGKGEEPGRMAGTVEAESRSPLPKLTWVSSPSHRFPSSTPSRPATDRAVVHRLLTVVWPLVAS